MFKVGDKVIPSFKVGDRVKFKKSSLDSGMIDATEDDVFVVNGVMVENHKTCIQTTHERGEWYTIKHFEHAEEEIMNNVDAVADHYVPEVGDKVKGFAFESGTDDIYYAPAMNTHVGELGEVVHVCVDRYVVQFDSTACSWSYPISLAHLAKMDSDESSDTAVPEDNTAIDWEIGQEVFCLLRGKGVVHQIYNTGMDWSEGVDVCFMNHGIIRFKFDGTISRGFNRSLFFSEPQIIAEKFPPKKPFTPALLAGEEIVVVHIDGYKEFITVMEDVEDRVFAEDGHAYMKSYHAFYKLGEEIKFN